MVFTFFFSLMIWSVIFRHSLQLNPEIYASSEGYKSEIIIKIRRVRITGFSPFDLILMLFDIDVMLLFDVFICYWCYWFDIDICFRHWSNWQSFKSLKSVKNCSEPFYCSHQVCRSFFPAAYFLPHPPQYFPARLYYNVLRSRCTTPSSHLLPPGPGFASNIPV